MIANFLTALGEISPFILVLTLVGVVIGIIFGAIPGLSTTMAIALCLPLTFKMDMFPGLALLIGLYIGGFSGGLISAILLNVPGTAASIATCFDGHPMARKGQAGKAMGLGIVFSFLGGAFSIIALIFISPLLASLAIQFGSFEYFSLCFFALTMIITMSSTNVAKNIASGLIGILTAMVGTDPIDAMPRFHFGITDLTGGFNDVAVMVGIFAVSELFILAWNRSRTPENMTVSTYKIKGFGFSLQEFWAEKVNFLRSSVIGTLIGILPGIGGSLASIVSYNTAKKTSRHPEQFGTGINAGVVASETANNAAIGGAMIPMLSLGIPGDAVTAILIGAFTMKGVQPGPLMFTDHADIVYFIFLALIIANIFMLVAEFLSIRGFVQLLRIPKTMLFPIIIFMCILGAYGLNHRLFDVITIFIFGVLGFLMKKWGMQFQPFIIGFIVGPMAEKNFRAALMFSSGSFMPFLTSPISLFFLIIAFGSIGMAIYKHFKNKKASKT